jgi:hypothetical protein
VQGQLLGFSTFTNSGKSTCRPTRQRATFL